MKRVLLVLLLLPLVCAQSDIDIFISRNNIVREDFTTRIYSDESYEAFEFYTDTMPFSIMYNRTYNVVENGGYIILFDKEILPGENIIRFSLLFDDLVEDKREYKIFSAAFEDVDKITLTLPEKHILSERPETIPEPEITSDGRRIKLSWDFEGDAAITVFYEGDDKTFLILSSIAVVIMMGIVLYIYSRKSVQNAISGILSEDEQAVIDELKSGSEKQKDISKKLGFSKSKMSKVVRKLEEKNLIEKKPYFKTNKIRLKRL